MQMTSVVDASEKLRYNIHFSDMDDMPATGTYDAIPEVSTRNTCPLPSGVMVHMAHVSDDAKVGTGYSIAALPLGMNKHPASPWIEGRRWARLTRFPRAKSSCEWVLTPLEMSNRLKNAVDLVGSG